MVEQTSRSRRIIKSNRFTDKEVHTLYITDIKELQDVSSSDAGNADVDQSSSCKDKLSTQCMARIPYGND
jgi:hypothetical protein